MAIYSETTQVHNDFLIILTVRKLIFIAEFKYYNKNGESNENDFCTNLTFLMYKRYLLLVVSRFQFTVTFLQIYLDHISEK